MKLQSLTKYTLNQVIGLPLVGDVTFDQNNQVEIKDELVNDLLKLEFGIKLEKIGNKKEAKPVIIEDKQEELVEVQENNESDLKKESLNNLSLNELKELLKEFPRKETRLLVTKKAIVDFLITKI